MSPSRWRLPAGIRSPVGADLRASLGAVFGQSTHARPALELEVDRPARISRHDWRHAEVDLAGYAASGLPARTMGRSLLEDPLFFAAALAGGAALAELANGTPVWRRRSDESLDGHELGTRGMGRTARIRERLRTH